MGTDKVPGMLRAAALQQEDAESDGRVPFQLGCGTESDGSGGSEYEGEV